MSLTLKNPEPDIEKLYPISHYLIRSRPPLKHNLERSELLNRAWVFQERVLSPRYLHFHQQQLFWECRQLDACEWYPHGLPLSRLGSHWDDPKFRDLFTICDSNSVFGLHLERVSFRDKRAVSKVWAQAVEKYSAAGITVKTDKLIALAGVATEMQS